MSTPAPAAPPKMGLVLRVIVTICGIAVMLGGFAQIKSGLRKIKGDPEAERLAKESDSAFDQANKYILEAAPVFQAVLESVDNDGLAAVRTGKKDETAKAADLFDQASQQLRLAGQRATEAAALKPGEKVQAFLETKAEAYRNFAAARDINRDIARMILDETIKTGEELVPKVMEAAERRDKLEASANEAIVRANKMVADSEK